jgi:50S ribosomal subunit-associated GTPase HflX
MQIDNTDDPLKVKEEAEKQGIICISAMNGDGLDEFCNAIQSKLKVRFVLAWTFALCVAFLIYLE